MSATGMDAIELGSDGAELQVALGSLHRDASSALRRRFFEVLLRARLTFQVAQDRPLKAAAIYGPDGRAIWPVFTDRKVLERAMIVEGELGTLPTVNVCMAAIKMGTVVVLEFGTEYQQELSGETLRLLAEGINPVDQSAG